MFTELTRPDGTALWLGEGMGVRPAPATAAEGSKAEITYAGGTYYVRETPEEVVAKVLSTMGVSKRISDA